MIIFALLLAISYAQTEVELSKPLGFGCKLPKEAPIGYTYDGSTWLVGCDCGGCPKPKMHGVTCAPGYIGKPTTLGCKTTHLTVTLIGCRKRLPGEVWKPPSEEEPPTPSINQLPRSSGDTGHLRPQKCKDRIDCTATLKYDLCDSHGEFCLKSCNKCWSTTAPPKNFFDKAIDLWNGFVRGSHPNRRAFLTSMGKPLSVGDKDIDEGKELIFSFQNNGIATILKKKNCYSHCYVLTSVNYNGVFWKQGQKFPGAPAGYTPSIHVTAATHRLDIHQGITHGGKHYPVIHHGSSSSSSKPKENPYLPKNAIPYDQLPAGSIVHMDGNKHTIGNKLQLSSPRHPYQSYSRQSSYGCSSSCSPFCCQRESMYAYPIRYDDRWKSFYSQLQPEQASAVVINPFQNG